MTEDKSSGVYNDMDKEFEKSSDERFLRFEEDRDKAQVFFAGTPYSRYVYWDGKQTREWSEDCGQKKNLRMAQNVIICKVEKGKLEILSVKVLEQGRRFFQNVRKRDRKYGIQNWIFEIERFGKKGDLATNYDLQAEYELSDKDKEKLMSMKLFDLAKFYAELGDGDSDNNQRSQPDNQEESEKEDDDADTIITDEQSKELIRLLKTFDNPEATGRKVVKEFGIKKVKELRKAQFNKALKYMDKLTADEHPESGDDSPF